MNSKSRSRRWAILCMSPVSRLSMATTEWPRSSRASQRWELMKPAAPVMTVLGMGTLEEAANDGEPHDLQIQGHRPVFDVVQVVLDTLFERGIAAPAVHLRPSRDAGLHFVAEHVLRDPVPELLHEEGAFRPRADDRHLTFEDVPELWQLVEVEAAQPAADRRRARVVFARPHRPAGVFGVVLHRAELVDGEWPAVEAHALLRVEDRPA